MRVAAGQSPRVLIRGAGSIGRRHARVFRELGAQVQIWPVRPRNEGGSFIDDAAGPAASGSADLVVVATDTARHVADAIQALDAGCGRLLLEKPVAPTLTECQPLQEHLGADRVFVAAPLRAHHGFERVRTALAERPAPSAASVWAQSWLPDWRPDRDYRESYSARPDEGGVLRDLVHEIDYVTALLGPPADWGSIAAILSWSGPLEIAAEQAATLTWRTATTTVQARLDYITRPGRRGIVLTGPEGSVSWDLLTATIRLAGSEDRPDGAVAAEHWPDDLDRDQVMARQARAVLKHEPRDPTDWLLAAGAPATLAEGCRSVQICDAARAADAAHAARGADPVPWFTEDGDR